MRQQTPDHAEIEAAVAAAQTLADNSAATRRRWRRRKAPVRQAALEGASERCAEAAPQLRSWIGMCAWGGIAVDDELAMKRVMEALRYERRQIGKMLE